MLELRFFIWRNDHGMYFGLLGSERMYRPMDLVAGPSDPDKRPSYQWSTARRVYLISINYSFTLMYIIFDLLFLLIISQRDTDFLCGIQGEEVDGKKIKPPDYSLHWAKRVFCCHDLEGTFLCPLHFFVVSLHSFYIKFIIYWKLNYQFRRSCLSLNAFLG